MVWIGKITFARKSRFMFCLLFALAWTGAVAQDCQIEWEMAEGVWGEPIPVEFRITNQARKTREFNWSIRAHDAKVLTFREGSQGSVRLAPGEVFQGRVIANVEQSPKPKQREIKVAHEIVVTTEDGKACGLTGTVVARIPVDPVCGIAVNVPDMCPGESLTVDMELVVVPDDGRTPTWTLQVLEPSNGITAQPGGGTLPGQGTFILPITITTSTSTPPGLHLIEVQMMLDGLLCALRNIEVYVRPPGLTILPGTVSGCRGETVMLPLLIKNLGLCPEEVNWNATKIGGQPEVHIDPASDTVTLPPMGESEPLQVGIAENSPSGIAEIELTAMARGLTQAGSGHVEVPSAYCSLTMVGARVLAGSSARLTGILTNTHPDSMGCTETFKWEMVPPFVPLGMTFQPSMGEISLGPGDSREITLQISTQSETPPSHYFYQVRVSVGGQVVCNVPVTISVFNVSLKSVTFHDAVPVDTDEAHGVSYPTRNHWLDNSSPLDGDAEDVGDWRLPVCYTSGASMVVSPGFQSIPFLPRDTWLRLTPSASQSASSLAITSPFVRPLTLGNAPRSVDFIESYTIDWKISLDYGATWHPVGTSDNRLYVLLRPPRLSPIRETVLDISCRNAKGSTRDAQVVRKIYSDFTDQEVKRKEMDGFNVPDGKVMRYWGEIKDKGNQTPLPIPVSCHSLAGMLDPTPTSLRYDGVGSCRAWARLLWATIRVQGIATPRVGPDLIQVDSNYHHFLVKRWSFGTGTVPLSYAPFTHIRDNGKQLCPEDGVVAQGVKNPPSVFADHFILRYEGRFYDPSYGSPPAAGYAAWETASLEAHCKRAVIGGMAFFICKPEDPSILETRYKPLLVLSPY